MSTRRARSSGVWVLLLLGAGLAGCASTSTPSGSISGAAGAERGRAAAQAADSAQRATAAGRLREALWWWRTAEAVAPDPTAARSAIATLETRLASEAGAMAARGAEQERAHDERGAYSSYMAALQLQPRQPAALQALQAMETADVLHGVSVEQTAAARSGARRKSRPAK